MRWNSRASNRSGTIKAEKTYKYIANLLKLLKGYEINHIIDYLLFILSSSIVYKRVRNNNDQLL
jgi:hypothetical protein